MALTEEIFEDKIEVQGDNKVVSIRTTVVVKRDGVEISKNSFRRYITPDTDISNESAEVQSICNSVHTDAVKSAWLSVHAPSAPE